MSPSSSSSSSSSSPARSLLPTEPAALLELARSGDRVALARLLSYIDRGSDTGDGRRGAGVPRRHAVHPRLDGHAGAGKSTLTDGLITAVRGGWPAVEGSRAEAEAKTKTEAVAEAVPQVGVLAVDPTSPFSGGAILGDRVRMSQHTLDPTVFIRSSAVRGGTSAACRSPCPTPCACSAPRASGPSSSRPWASARWRSRSPWRPTPRPSS